MLRLYRHFLSLFLHIAFMLTADEHEVIDEETKIDQM